MTRSELSSDLSLYNWYSILAIARRHYQLSTLCFHAFSFAAVIVALNLFAQCPLNATERLLASAIVAIPILPIELWLLGIDKTIPVVPFYSLTYAVMFGISLFLVDNLSTGLFGQPVDNAAIEAALALLLIGICCFFVGYYGPLPWLIGEVTPHFKLSWRNPHVVRISLWIMTSIGLVFAFPNIPGLPEAFEQLNSFGSDLFTLGVCGLLALQLSTGLGLGQTILLWMVFIPLRVVVGLASGLTGAGLLPALTLCLVYASVRHVFPWKAIIIGTLAFFILRPVEGAYRIDIGNSGTLNDRSASEKFEHFMSLTETVTRFAWFDPSDVLQISAHRLALTPTFAKVIDDTPRIVPYWMGTTYYPILFKLIPRFIFPDKPEEVTGQEFGHRYALIDVTNLTTSINLPQIVELYANFGTIGVLLGMFLFGVIIRTVLNIYLRPGMGFGAVVAVFYLASKLIDFQSAFSMIFGAFPWELIFIALVHLLVSTAELDADLILRRGRSPVS
jgi:hypothetical protein